MVVRLVVICGSRNMKKDRRMSWRWQNWDSKIMSGSDKTRLKMSILEVQYIHSPASAQGSWRWSSQTEGIEEDSKAGSWIYWRRTWSGLRWHNIRKRLRWRKVICWKKKKKCIFLPCIATLAHCNSELCNLFWKQQTGCWQLVDFLWPCYHFIQVAHLRLDSLEQKSKFCC